MPKSERYPTYVKSEDIVNSPFNKPQVTMEEYIAEQAEIQKRIKHMEEEQAKKTQLTCLKIFIFIFICAFLFWILNI
jgi:hypothetical protein